MEEEFKKNAKRVPEPSRDAYRAVVYYRQCAKLGQKIPLKVQQDNVRTFAKKYNIEIVNEYLDRRSPGGETIASWRELKEMVRLVEKDDSFQFVLCYDSSRWGRSHGKSMTNHYETLCSNHGKKVIYTCLNVFDPNNEMNPLITQLRRSIDRYQAAEYARHLSKKVSEGCAKKAKLGYWLGGPPPYGMERLMVDQHNRPVQVLRPGQRAALKNGHVILQPGCPEEVAVIRDIFRLFVDDNYSEMQIAELLNSKNIHSPYGCLWKKSIVLRILRDEHYAGAIVYNKTSRKLGSKKVTNAPEEWIVIPNCHEAIVSQEVFEQVRKKIDAQKTSLHR